MSKLRLFYINTLLTLNVQMNYLSWPLANLFTVLEEFELPGFKGCNIFLDNINASKMQEGNDSFLNWHLSFGVKNRK